jgi:thiamine transporter ThiT
LLQDVDIIEWKELTPQHQKYVIFSITIGASLGLFSSIISFTILSLITGAGLTITGGFAAMMKSRYDKEEAEYRTWGIIFLTSILCAITCAGVAFFGLYCHQNGMI